VRHIRGAANSLAILARGRRAVNFA
jgi:hypothetical protein